MPKKKSGPTGDVYPLDDRGVPVQRLSVGALMGGELGRLIVYRKPYDLSQEVERNALADELDPDAVLPDDDGVHYLLYLVPDDEAAQARAEGREPEGVAFLLPEGHVHPFMLGVAACDSVTTAQQFTYRRGLLPNNDLLAGPE